MEKQLTAVSEKHKKAFTLIELIVVVIVLGAITALAATAYQKTVTIQSIKRLRNDLITFHGAQAMYRAKTGSAYKTNCADTDVSLACTDAINSQLAIQINLDKNVKYNHFFTAGNAQTFFTLKKIPQCVGVMFASQPISATNPRFFTSCPYAAYLK